MTYKKLIKIAKLYDYEAELKRPFLLLENPYNEFLIGINTEERFSIFTYGGNEIPNVIRAASYELSETAPDCRGEI